MKSIKKILACFLALLLICAAVFINTINVSALSVRQGYITGDGVNIRKGPATSYESLGKLSKNTPVTVTGVGFEGSNKTIWYSLTAKTSNGDITGYVHYNYVKITGSSKSYPGVIKSNSVIYNHPGTWHTKLCDAPKGMTLTAIGEELDFDGDKWYHVLAISGNQIVEGYAYSEKVQLDTYVNDKDFEKELEEQGFPESYKVKLRQVHGLYPNWKFIADHVNVTWDEAVLAECATGVNTTAASSPEAWKSMDKNAYDWSNGTYVVRDNGGWVEAADNVVKYYLDPRNFIGTNSEIFQFIKMNYDPTLNTKENVQAAVKGTFMEGEFPEDTYKTYVDVLMEAAKQSGVSPISLVAMIVVEQGSAGIGKCISGTQEGYEGYYNFYNINAFPKDGNSAVTNGLIYAKNQKWDSRAKAIIGGAHFYADNYIARGQNNLYYKKFNVVYKPYFGHQYMTNVQASAHEAIQTAKGYASLTNSELVFNIPVYKNMPETVMPYPSRTGNNNCYLDNISLGEDYTYTPTFDRYTENYEAIVEGEVEEIEITPVKSYSGATVTGGGKVKLKVGTNNFEITVKSTSGQVKTYTISIFRKNPPEVVDPKINSSVYTLKDDKILNVMPVTSKDVFVTNLNVENGTAKLTHDGNIKNGDTVEIFDTKGNLRYTYKIVVSFDTNGDGKCTLVDLSLVKRHLLKSDELTGDKFFAADINQDGKISLSDLSLIKRRLLKLDS